jgi:hypothetical protein
MSKPYMFLAAVIPGPSSPTVGVDIYLQPLIDDLKRLWEGVVTYDISRKRNGIGPGETWTELCRKWDDPAYIAKCKRNKQNRAAQPESSIHTGGSTSSGTLRIRFIRDHGRVPTLLEMNEMLHRRSDGTWDSVRAKRANVSLLIFYEFIN